MEKVRDTSLREGEIWKWGYHFFALNGVSVEGYLSLNRDFFEFSLDKIG
jgi:hypothetical protein